MTVEVLEDMWSEALGNRRDVYVYLPPGYHPARGPYPVLYLHDGQHMFASAGPAPSWRLDETLDDLISRGSVPPLVAVGVANAGADRGAEYSHEIPFPRDPASSPARGRLYETFLIDELIPLVRQRYSVTSDPAATAVMGSSMGGLVSYHLAFGRPEVFGLAAIMSPFFVSIDPVTLAKTPVHRIFDRRGPDRIWIDMGGMEGLITVEPVLELVQHLVTELGYTPDDDLRYRYDPEGRHHEDVWAERARSAVLHLFGAGGPAEPTVAPGPDGNLALGIGQLIDASPLGRRADGCTYSILTAQVDWRPERLLKRVGGAFLAAAAAGDGEIVARVGSHTVTTGVIVTSGEAQPALDVTVVVPLDTPLDASVSFSGLPTQHIRPGLHHGHWPLPRGVGLDGTVGLGWRGAGLDANGVPVRHPLRHDAARRIVVRVERWTNPDHGGL
ncbi:alpha/beta hydrolase-fold protein [Nonomuraea sp. NPDC050404]|uniref:alpha/beta hydrolase n=1 Tax=Nonomuraea sp. NPDC050404 TaxID=3155783 RepID=UPI0033D67AE6